MRTKKQVENKDKVKNPNKNKFFREHYFSLPNMPALAKEQIMQRCQITSCIFNDWLSGRTRVPLVYHKTISEILNKPVSELFPSELYQTIKQVRRKRTPLRTNRNKTINS